MVGTPDAAGGYPAGGGLGLQGQEHVPVLLAQAQQAGVHVAQVVQTPAPASNPYSFAPPVAQAQPASNPLTFSPPGQEATPRFASPSQVQPPPVQPVVQPAASSARDYSYASNNSARCDEELPF